MSAAERDRATEKLRRAVERRTATYLWGKRYFPTPRLVDAIFGNGRALLAVTPIATRPLYYIVRVDDRWNLDDERTHGAGPEKLDVRDGLLYFEQEVARQFGDHHFSDDDGDPIEHDGDTRRFWPQGDFSIGKEWCSIPWPKGCGPKRSIPRDIDVDEVTSP